LIIEKIEFIALYPETGKSIENVKSGYWSVAIKSHYIFYKHGENGIIEIIRILHQKMNIETSLRENY
jgi:toxin ParE1/3/4